LGNHEEMLLAALGSDEELRTWLECRGEETLSSYPYDSGREMIPEDHVQFLRGCADFHETQTHIFAHANYDHRLPMDRIGGSRLRWEFLEQRRQWSHCSGRVVVVGHTPEVSSEVLDLGFLVCIDTDCSRGGWLTALDVVTGRVVQTGERGELRERRVLFDA
jgi:serine/threonine protein phosphatase 1